MGKPTLLVPGKLAGAAGRENPDVVPIDFIIRRLRRAMPEFGGAPPVRMADRVFVIKSDTGSGKSTVLPAHVFRLLRSEKSDPGARFAGPGVVCTQPRILTAQTIARDQAADENYPDLVMGATVGYQTGPINEKPLSGLIYATAGSLLAQLRLLPDADIMARYRFIIVDEAHERSLDIDALLMQLKAFLRRNMGNPRLPFLLLASATLPVEKYAAYFDLPADNVIRVEGRTFDVAKHWLAAGTNDYMKEAARVALAIHEANQADTPDQADILIFMPGLMEIGEVWRRLDAANWKFLGKDSKIRPYLLVTIHREIITKEERDYRLIKEDPENLLIATRDGAPVRPLRRIIISTVVAETGITIETLKYVIDCGWSRVQEIYFPGRYRGIVTRPAPQSRITQRMGRAGRKFPGQFYPLYTHNVFRALPQEQLPDIIMEGVAPIFLDVVKTVAEAGAPAAGEGVFRVENIDMLDPPPVDALAAALDEAVTFGYLRVGENAAQGRGHVLTGTGEIAARFNFLHMSHAQTLMAGYLWRVSIRDLALIVTLFEATTVSVYKSAPLGQSRKAEEEAYRRTAQQSSLPSHLGDVEKARELIADDFIMTLLVFNNFVRAADNAEGDLEKLLDWCDGTGLDFYELVRLAAERDAVVDEIISAGLNPFWGGEYSLESATPETFLDTVGRLKHCIYAGLQKFVVRRGGDGRYRTAAGDVVGGVEGPPVEAFVTNVVRLRGVPPDSRDKSPPFLYRLSPGLVSALDGYLDVDAELNFPRQV